MDYVAMRAKANALINKFSDLSISYSVLETSGYTKRMNPVTNEFDWYLNGVVSTEPSPTTYTGTCFESSITYYFKSSSYIKETDKVFTSASIPVPQINEKVTVDGEEYTVVRIISVKPSTVNVMVKLIVRK